MPVFWILIVLATFFLWLLASFLYKPIGRLFSRLWNDAMDAMKDEKPKQDETTNQESEKE